MGVVIDNLFEYTGDIFCKIPLSGGDINDVYKIETSRGVFVIKENNNSPSQMFEKEAKGLEELSALELPVPKVYCYSKKYLLMEYLSPGCPRPSEAGELLGRLHVQKKSYFGLNYDNYIGKLYQKNSPHQNWVNFFSTNRLDYPLKALKRQTEQLENLDIWEKFKKKLPDLIPPCEPALIHGDLWSGNLYWGEKKPYFIDPAIYYADPMIELAFIEFFGNFGKKFIDAYCQENPINKEYKSLKSLYIIYPLLVHANLFGGDYYASALRNAKYYI